MDQRVKESLQAARQAIGKVDDVATRTALQLLEVAVERLARSQDSRA